MKKIFLMVTLLIFLVPATASGTFPIFKEWTLIKGTITDEFGDPVKDAQVQVDCHHDGSVNTGYDTSWANGHYEVWFDRDECDHGDLVDVFVTKGEASGYGSTTMVLCGDHFCGIVLVDVVDVQIPEFGLIAGMAAVMISLLGFIYLRKE